MSDPNKKTTASALRKEGKYEEAVVLYKELWETSGDNFDGWGLLNCLRKLKRYEEALQIANQVQERFPKDDWCNIEVAWVFIQAVLLRLPNSASLEEVLEEAEKIISLKPGDIALRFVSFKVLKVIKKYDKWQYADEWLEKINPDNLDEKPIAESFGPRGWSYKVLWYNYKLKTLLENEKYDEVIELSNVVAKKFPFQKKHILRFKGIALRRLGKLDESIAIYSELSKGFKADWWLLHEYALVLNDKGLKKESLALLFRAASGNLKLEMMVSLFEDIGHLLLELNRKEDALSHFLLSKYVREKNSWKVSSEIQNKISELDVNSDIQKKYPSIKETYDCCKKIWSEDLGDQSTSRQGDRKIRKGLRGIVKLGLADNPFCFIHCPNKETFFCNKSNLPDKSKEGETVIFDAIPSFDVKKQKESWKAVNIRKEK